MCSMSGDMMQRKCPPFGVGLERWVAGRDASKSVHRLRAHSQPGGTPLAVTVQNWEGNSIMSLTRAGDGRILRQ